MRACFRCRGPHQVKDCPVPAPDGNKKKDRTHKDKSKDKPKDADKDKDSDEPVAKKARIGLAAWKYLEPEDLTKPLIEDGNEWKFCCECKCHKTNRVGIYQLFHFDAEHIENYMPPNQGNLASVQDLVPLGIPAATTKDPPTGAPEEEEDDIEFVGAWCAPVVSFADPDLTPDNHSPYNDYPSSSDMSLVGTWCAPVTLTDATFVAAIPVEREILVDDPADFDCIDPFLVWMSYKCEPVMTCVACDMDWRERLEDYLASIKPSALWSSSKELLSVFALQFLRAAEPTEISSEAHFERSYEDECIQVEHDGSLFYDPEPVDGVSPSKMRTRWLVSFALHSGNGFMLS